MTILLSLNPPVNTHTHKTIISIEISMTRLHMLVHMHSQFVHDSIFTLLFMHNFRKKRKYLQKH